MGTSEKDVDVELCPVPITTKTAPTELEISLSKLESALKR